jgi:hypothetical protein
MAAIKKLFEWFFYLIENIITPDPKDKIAKVRTGKTKKIDDIAERIVKERTEYRLETIVNILTLANTVKLDFLSQGNSVNDGIVILEPTITGTFVETTDFDESRHTCVINAHVTNSVQAMLKQVKGSYSGLTVENGGASITGVIDSFTGSANEVITPEKIVTITGNKIRIVPEEGETVESCITYTNLATDAVVTQEDPPGLNDPSKIMLKLPALTPGFYSLTLKTLFTTSGSPPLKAPRFITFKGKLQVKAAGEPGRQGEFYPKPPTEPYVKVSLHTARLILTGFNL